ncbi:MAG: hypothetical protein J1F05_06605 [Muribaculaceae bacterium]|nr:hypothetical protein [Muribaculaceae bacterium]
MMKTSHKVALVVACILAVVLVFETYRFLVDFPPVSYEASDTNFVIKWVVVLLVALFGSWFVLRYRKIKWLAVGAFAVLSVVTCIVVLGFESNIRSTKRFKTNLDEIGRNHVAEVEQLLSEREQELEMLKNRVYGHSNANKQTPQIESTTQNAADARTPAPNSTAKSTSSNNKNFSELWEEAGTEYCAENYEKAKEIYKEANKLAGGNNFECQLEIGICSYLLSDFDNAISYFKAALKHNKNVEEVYWLLGESYYTGHKDLEEAIKWFKKSAERGYAEGMCDLGMCYDEKGEVELAKTWLKRALESSKGLSEDGKRRAELILHYYE